MEEIREQLNRIEQLALLSAKNALTIDDVAMLTGYTKQSLYRMTSMHQIPHYKPNGKALFFKRDEIEEWMLQNRVDTIQESEQRALSYVMGKK